MTYRRAVLPAIAVCAAASLSAQSREVFHYVAEWRFVDAATIDLEFETGRSVVRFKTAGVIANLYDTHGDYTTVHDDALCVSSIFLRAVDPRRPRETRVTFQTPPGKGTYRETNPVTGVDVATHETPVPPCVHDVIAALARLRGKMPAVGETIRLPLSDGRRAIDARIDAQKRETLRTPAGKFDAIRYEAHVLGNKLYRRNGRLFIWLTTGGKHIPVQFLIDLPFYFGDIMIRLVKEGPA